MSRLARKPVQLPSGVTLSEQEGTYLIKGPKGELNVLRLSGVSVVPAEDNQLTVTRVSEDRQAFANVGTQWSLIRNAALGVTEGYKKVLEIQGVGYRAAMEGTKINLSLGFSHPVIFEPLPGVDLAVEKNLITVTGIDKEAVGQTAALIRKYRKPEPYKGKGIRYQGEVVRMKAGKKAGK